MSHSEPPFPALDQVRQLNRLFLEFLRSRPVIASEEFGLSPAATEPLCTASPPQIARAANFPRALFRLRLPPAIPGAVLDPLGQARDTGRRVLQLTLLQSAWHLCRPSGYAARLLLRLTDADIRRLREAEMQDIVEWSLADNLVRAAFDDLDWIWRKLLTESRPEQRRRLALIGLQPDFSLLSAVAIA
jgi:hypothetical protein